MASSQHSSLNNPLTPEMLVPRLGEALITRGFITSQQLETALEVQEQIRRQGRSQLLGHVLIDLGFLSQENLDKVITEQIIQLRAALQEQNQQLEIRVQERTAELQHAYSRLSELNQLKSNIVANISHELRTPLTHIKCYVELLLEGEVGLLGEEQRKTILVIQQSTQRLENRVEDLIRFADAARGEFTLRLSPTDPKVLCEHIISRSLQQAEGKSISIAGEYSSKLPAVNADEEKLSWAVLQLVDNAIKFTPTGGRIQVRVHQAERLVTFQVQDTGIGIPVEHQEEIFEPFQQVDPSSTRRYGGTGLGLALVKKIIEAHGSQVKVHSQVGQGTCFEFTLLAAAN